MTSTSTGPGAVIRFAGTVAVRALDSPPVSRSTKVVANVVPRNEICEPEIMFPPVTVSVKGAEPALTEDCESEVMKGANTENVTVLDTNGPGLVTRTLY